MTPSQIRGLADRLERDRQVPWKLSAEVLRACADLLDGLDQRNSTTDIDWVRVGFALKRIEEIAP